MGCDVNTTAFWLLNKKWRQKKPINRPLVRLFQWRPELQTSGSHGLKGIFINVFKILCTFLIMLVCPSWASKKEPSFLNVSSDAPVRPLNVALELTESAIQASAITSVVVPTVCNAPQRQPSELLTETPGQDRNRDRLGSAASENSTYAARTVPWRRSQLRLPCKHWQWATYDSIT